MSGNNLSIPYTLTIQTVFPKTICKNDIPQETGVYTISLVHLKNNNSDKSAVVEYLANTGNLIDLDKVIILLRKRKRGREKNPNQDQNSNQKSQ